MSNEIEKDIEYRTKDIKATLGIVPHVVIVKPEDNEIGRKVLKYSTIRSYDKVSRLEPIEFTEGIAYYKGNYKGFLIYVNAGSVLVNWDGNTNKENGLLDRGITLVGGDIFGITDVELKIIGIKLLLLDTEASISLFR